MTHVPIGAGAAINTALRRNGFPFYLCAAVHSYVTSGVRPLAVTTLRSRPSFPSCRLASAYRVRCATTGAVFVAEYAERNRGEARAQTSKALQSRNARLHHQEGAEPVSSTPELAAYFAREIENTKVIKASPDSWSEPSFIKWPQLQQRPGDIRYHPAQFALTAKGDQMVKVPRPRSVGGFTTARASPRQRHRRIDR